MFDPNIFVSGSARSAEWIPLRAGPLAMEFDPVFPSLRYLRLGEREILRSIYAAVRDRNWGTVSPRVCQLGIDSGPEWFRIEIEVECRQDDIDFLWQGMLVGRADGTVSFTFDGCARSTFLRNRIGLCVLHPIVGCAGRPCCVEHHDGVLERGEFPQLISPGQPFRQIRAIAHEVNPGLTAEVHFEGDVFEMEDQRNWTDASFKIYSTPLELPFPVRVEQGSHIRQEVRLRLMGGVERVEAVSVPIPTLTVSRTKPFSRPPIGLGIASHDQPLTARESQRLNLLGLSHLRVDLILSDARWRETLRRAADEAGPLGIALHAALHLSSRAESELDQLVQELRSNAPPISLWIIYHVEEKVTSEFWVQLAMAKLAAVAPSVPFGAGTNANFAELNRRRPGRESIALPCYSINPQVHAFGNASLVENLAAQGDTVATAWHFARRPLVISTVTLRPRFNPDATVPTEARRMIELPPEVDVRQLSLFGAAWTLGSIAQLSCTGHVHSLTYYETTGWRGVMETGAGSPLPERFPSLAGAVFPMFHVLADLAAYDRACPIACSHPLLACGLALLDRQDRLRVLLGSLCDRTQNVRVQISSCQCRVRLLDARTVEQACRDPETFRSVPGIAYASASGVLELSLPAFSIACLDARETREPNMQP